MEHDEIKKVQYRLANVVERALRRALEEGAVEGLTKENEVSRSSHVTTMLHVGEVSFEVTVRRRW